MKEQLERDIERLLSITNDLNGVQNDVVLTPSLLDIQKEDLKGRFQSLRDGLSATRKGLEYKLENDTKEQREFKNKDFHVKVWQDSDAIYIETRTADGEKRRMDCIPKDLNPTNAYEEIVGRLELEYNQKPKEVSIWDVIEECKGVTDKGEMNRILDKYERVFNHGKEARRLGWKWLESPYSFIADGYQLRLKEQK